MAKKTIKPAVKFSKFKFTEKQKKQEPLIKNVKKVLLASEGKKQRGRKAGVKFEGGYKKNKNVDVELMKQFEQSDIETLKPIEVVSEIQNNLINNTEPKNEFVKTGEDQFNEFVNDSATNKNVDDNEYTKETEKTFESSTAGTNTNFNTSNTGTGTNTGGLVNGYMLLSICDFVFPVVLKKVVSIIDRNNKDLIESIKISELQLTNDQKDALKASADMVANYLFAQMSPITVFTLSLGVFYYSNLKMVIDDKKENFYNQQNETKGLFFEPENVSKKVVRPTAKKSTSKK
jgi:hypothetical protein